MTYVTFFSLNFFVVFPEFLMRPCKQKDFPKFVFSSKTNKYFFVSPKITFRRPFTFLRTYVIFTITKKYDCT